MTTTELLNSPLKSMKAWEQIERETELCAPKNSSLLPFNLCLKACFVN